MRMIGWIVGIVIALLVFFIIIFFLGKPRKKTALLEQDASILLKYADTDSDNQEFVSADGTVRLKGENTVYQLTSRIIRGIYQLTITDTQENVIGKIESRNLRYTKLVDDAGNTHEITPDGFAYHNEHYSIKGNEVWIKEKRLMTFSQDERNRMLYHVRFEEYVAPEIRKWYVFFVFANLVFYTHLGA